MRITNTIILILAGLVIANLKYNGTSLISFPNGLLDFIVTIALVIVVFDACSRLNFKRLDTLHFRTIRFVFASLILLFVLLAAGLYFLFGITSIGILLLFGLLMATSAYEIHDSRHSKNKVEEILRTESLLSNPLALFIAFIVIDLMVVVQKELTLSNFSFQIAPLIQRIVLGIGTGIIVGIIILKLIRHKHTRHSSFTLALVGALLSYVFAESIAANGLLAVAIYGLFFSHVYIKEKKGLMLLSAKLIKYLTPLIVILFALLAKLQLDYIFIVKSLVLFIIYLLARCLAVHSTFKHYLSKEEKLLIVFDAPKGMAVMVLGLAMFLLNIGQGVLGLLVIFVVCSSIASMAVPRFIGQND